MQMRTNTIAINAHRNLNITGNNMLNAANRLASGFRINSAADDAAGMAISETMQAQIRGLDQASRNAQDGVSLMRTAGGALHEVHGMLQRIREIALQALNDTLAGTNRTALQTEIDQLLEETNHIAQTEFNRRPLFDGELGYKTGTATGGGLWLQLGPNPGQGTNFFIEKLGAYELFGTNTPDVDFEYAKDISKDIIDNIDKAIDHVNMERVRLGAYETRLEFTTRSLDVSSENLQEAESRIRNADMALEMMRFIRYQVLQQTGMMVMAQANHMPGTFVRLLG